VPQVRSESEMHLTFAARLPAKPAHVSILQIHVPIYRQMGAEWNFWITLCPGRRQTSKTSCSISGPASTTISRIPHGKGEHPIERSHDQSQISARFDGNLIVGPLSDTGGCLISQRFALAAVSGRLLQKPRMQSSCVRVLSCSAFRSSDRFTAAVSIRQRQGLGPGLP
jgi:hypothetical protein